jgi:uncharacterized protein YkwD
MSNKLMLHMFSRLFLCSILTLFLTIVPNAVSGQSTGDSLYLPFIVSALSTNGPNEQEQQIAELLHNEHGQQRPYLHYSVILATVARQRATDMAQRAYMSHINPDGQGPNYLVRQAGYVLPAYYGQALDANNIESIAAGQTTAKQTWADWLASPAHRTHVLGTDPFYAAQVDYGVGYVYKAGSPYGYYWVVITAQPVP